MYCFVFLTALLIGLATPALAQKRVALVIGNRRCVQGCLWHPTTHTLNTVLVVR